MQKYEEELKNEYEACDYWKALIEQMVGLDIRHLVLLEIQNLESVNTFIIPYFNPYFNL